MGYYNRKDNYTWPGQPHQVRRAYKDGDDIVVEFDDDATTFELLSELSETFGTKHINVGAVAREGGYCDTCRYSYGVAVVRISKVTKDPFVEEE